MHALCIKLFVLDGRIYIDGVHQLHTKETAASCRVGEQARRVARTNERGDARQCGGIAGMGLAHTQRRHLHQVLQRALLACRVTVKLIEIDEQTIREAMLTLALSREVKAVGVEHTQLARHQHTTKGTLVPSLLLTDEDRRHAIGIERLFPTLRLCHEG